MEIVLSKKSVCIILSLVRMMSIAFARFWFGLFDLTLDEKFENEVFLKTK